MLKTKLQNHLKEILVHDVEAAAFLIVAVSLTATLTTFAMDKKENTTNRNISNKSALTNTPKTVYNPETVQIIDIDQDGFNDMIITHQDGHVEHSFSRN